MVVYSEWVSNKQHISPGIGTFLIAIGGIRCSIISQDTTFLDLLRTRYRWFESSGPADYEILVKFVPVEEPASGKITRAVPTIRKVNSGYDYIIKQADTQFIAVANTFSRKILVKTWRNENSFDSFLRLLYTLILSEERGLLLHASAASEDGRGAVFFRPYGGGKSTPARLSAGRTLFSDKMVIVRPHHDGYRVYGTPFWSEYITRQNNARAELAGLYSLKKDRRNALALLDKAQAMANLYQCLPPFDGDSLVQGRILDACHALVDVVPVYELHFMPDAPFWQILNEQRTQAPAQIFSNAGLTTAPHLER